MSLVFRRNQNVSNCHCMLSLISADYITASEVCIIRKGEEKKKNKKNGKHSIWIRYFNLKSVGVLYLLENNSYLFWWAGKGFWGSQKITQPYTIFPTGAKQVKSGSSFFKVMSVSMLHLTM